MITVPNGSGLYVPEGFSVPDGTGYVIPQRSSGCKAVWTGMFRDTFNYTAHASGHDTRFGPYWNVTGDRDSTYSLDTNSTGYFFGDGSFPPDGVWPSCSSIPVLGNQFAEVYSAQNGTTNHPTGGTPLFAGGPAIMLDSNGRNGYSVIAYNEFLNPASDFTHTFWVVLQGTDNNTDTTKYKLNTGGSGFNSSGWRTGTARLRLEGTTDGVSYTRLKVFLDSGPGSTPVIDYSFGTGRKSGYFGIYADSSCKLANYTGGAL